MTLKLTLFSQEKDDFVREILIDSDAKFAELHELILRDCNYTEHSGQSFLICDEDWHVKQHIRLQEDDDMRYDEDINLMSRTRVGDLLEDEGQRLAYVFDPDGKRFFLMELTENIFGRAKKEAFVNRKHGLPPMQSLSSSPVDEDDEEQEVSPLRGDLEGSESFYGDEGFEAEELDMEGYEIDE